MADLDDFVELFELNNDCNISVVSSEDLDILREEGYSVEGFLNHLVQKYQSLLHGSRNDIQDSHLSPRSGLVYATDLASIALLKAVLSNRGLRGDGLIYPINVNDRNPLEVKILGLNDTTVGKSGFVYVINNTKEFVNAPKTSWQYMANSSAPISAKIEVKLSDFKYPIYDISNRRDIQQLN